MSLRGDNVPSIDPFPVSLSLAIKCLYIVRAGIGYVVNLYMCIYMYIHMYICIYTLTYMNMQSCGYTSPFSRNRKRNKEMEPETENRR